MRPTIHWMQLEEGGCLPTQAHAGDAGFDLYTTKDHHMDPGETYDAPTGIAVQLPEGFYGRIIGRSSTIRKRGLLVVEGIIDQGYTGHLFFAVHNPSEFERDIRAGERLAQFILVPLVEPIWRRTGEFLYTERGSSGFGSTGT